MFDLKLPRHISTLPDSDRIRSLRQVTFRANKKLMHRNK